MKFTSPKSMALFLAIVFAIIVGLLTSIFVFTTVSAEVELWITYILSVFIIFYIIIYYAFYNFIIQKINPIYKTIYKTNISKTELIKKLESRDIFTAVNQDVDTWAQNKTSEIIQLQKLAKYRKEFLGNVSHELKTPLFSIQGYISTLLDGGLEDENINRAYLEKSDKNINRMIAIINDLETISKFETAELQLEFSDFDIIQLIKEVFEMHEVLASKHNITLKFKKSFSKPVMVNANREKVYNVLSNLIINSIKYGKENGLTTVDIMDMDRNLLIEIEDDGIGIEKSEIPRIFERFYRVDKSRSREAGGTGLGLAIVKHIIEAHKQTINCRSTFGKGSSFAFTLKKS